MKMQHFTSVKFVNETIDIDDKAYINCSFFKCVIRFSGTGPVSFKNCHFEECGIEFKGHAVTTVVFLRAIYHGLGDWGKYSVEGLFDEIRAPYEIANKEKGSAES